VAADGRAGRSGGVEKALAVLPYDTVTVFNSPGALIASGPLSRQKEKLISLFGRLPRSGGGFDLAFSEKKRAIFSRAFAAELADKMGA
jgi:hypothetical protein